MSPPPVTDLDWLALLVWSEARGEPTDGQAAVAQVALNRLSARYASDGTMQGTIEAKFQFSGFWFGWVDPDGAGPLKGRYVQICHTPAEALAQAGVLLAQATRTPLTWAAIRRICDEVMRGAYEPGGPGFRQLARDVVLYDNPDLCHPAWATPAAFVCKIGRHAFFRGKVGPGAPPPPPPPPSSALPPSADQAVIDGTPL